MRPARCADGVFRAVPIERAGQAADGIQQARNGRWVVSLDLCGEIIRCSHKAAMPAWQPMGRIEHTTPAAICCRLDLARPACLNLPRHPLLTCTRQFACCAPGELFEASFSSYEEAMVAFQACGGRISQGEQQEQPSPPR
jgi:hypothetical protein